MPHHMRFNIVQNEGDPSSVTVFIGRDVLLATKDHPNFARILDLLRSGAEDVEQVRGQFDVGRAIVKNFERLSERVTVAHGKLFFDGDEMESALAQAIVRFHADGNDDFKPLVGFLEKVEQNPQEHSRQQLFRWLQKHRFAIAPDGDFIAYKGVTSDEMSVTSGMAMVNGVLVNGQIPNKPDTIVEMPRSKVAFDPGVGCSTGLHAGNWRYAKEFSRGTVLRVKINPRDVVSVPTDSNDEKLRVCRYRVLNHVTAEDTTMLYVTDVEKLAKVVVPEVEAPAKESAGEKRKPKPKVTEFPEYYHDFKKVHFEACAMPELRWLAKEWEVKVPARSTKDALIAILMRAARRQRKIFQAES